MIDIKNQEHEVFKALSEPIRLRIMALLTVGELCVCDLTCVLGMPQSTISRHMNRLKVNGLVSDRRSGKWIHYSLDTGFTHTFPEFAGLFKALRAKDPYRSDQEKLKAYVKTKSCGEDGEGLENG
jgi:ArsR family transcriptional regulator